MILCLGTTPTLARTMQFARVELNGVNRAAEVYEYAAGKAINAARAAKTLGAETYCISPRGGANGATLSEHITASFHDAHFEVDAAADTRLCVTMVDRAAATSTELIQECGPLSEEEGERLLAAFAERLPRTRVAVLSGSLAPSLARNFYARCVAMCTAARVTSILDASGEPLRASLTAKPSVVKVNCAELAGVVPFDASDEPALERASLEVAGRTGGWVIVTRGEQATIAAHSRDGVWQASVVRAPVISAIGSGDSFAGALAVGMSRGHAMQEAIALGSACATANVMTPHAAHFSTDDVAQLRGEVMVTRLS